MKAVWVLSVIPPCADLGRSRFCSSRRLNGHVLLDFYPSHEHCKLRVTAAKLWLQLRPASGAGRKAPRARSGVALFVFRAGGNGTEALEHLGSLRDGDAGPGWRALDLSGAVQRWFADPAADKLTLLVDCAGCDQRRLEMVLFHDQEEPANEVTAARRVRHGHRLLALRPFLAVATEPGEEGGSRSRRHSRACGSRPAPCCRQELYVSFEELGWGDWIIAPRGYFANFCVGNCSGPRAPGSYSTFHTHVMEEWRARNPYASVRPCCAPTRLSPISIIYFDLDLNIIKTDLPKMIVEDCGCT